MKIFDPAKVQMWRAQMCRSPVVSLLQAIDAITNQWPRRLDKGMFLVCAASSLRDGLARLPAPAENRANSRNLKLSPRSLILQGNELSGSPARM